MKRRVLFVGGERASFSKLRVSLQQEPYELGHALDSKSALALLQVNKTHVVLADEDMPGRVIDFLAELQTLHPRTLRIMVTSGDARSDLIDAVNRAEVYRLCAKPLQPSKLARILREALWVVRVAEAQETVWAAAKQQRDALERLMTPGDLSHLDESDEWLISSRFVGLQPNREDELDKYASRGEEYAERLSLREKEIVEALSTGKRVKEIAQELVISSHTVRNHLKAIYRKLNVNSQLELVSLMTRSTKDGTFPPPRNE